MSLTLIVFIAWSALALLITGFMWWEARLPSGVKFTEEEINALIDATFSSNGDTDPALLLARLKLSYERDQREAHQ